MNDNVQLLKNAIEDMVTVDWSETDGKDVAEILDSHGVKKGSISKEELKSVRGLNLFMKEIIGKCLGIDITKGQMAERKIQNISCLYAINKILYYKQRGMRICV